MSIENRDLLFEFFNTPVFTGDEIYNRFKALPNAIYSQGKKPLQRYVFVPGTRADRVVLVAHIDTVWDKVYKTPKKHCVCFKNGIFSSASDECGIGADDRAGCAMLWKLRNSGHSLLIVDGEEHGKHGARYLKRSNPKLFKEINNHCFMIELDHIKTNHVSFEQVCNSEEFNRYFVEATGFSDYGLNGGCDLEILCKSICGANVGVGYSKRHTSKETLSLHEQENTYNVLKSFLSQPMKRFKINIFKRIFF